MHLDTITKLPTLPNVIVIGSLDRRLDRHHLVVTLSDRDPARSLCRLIGANLPQLKKTVIPEALLIRNPDF